MKRRRRWARGLAIVIGLLALGALALVIDSWRASGALAEGGRLERMQQSPQWKEGRFVDIIPRQEPALMESIGRWVVGVDNASPDAAIPIEQRTKADFASLPVSGLRATWFGHSSLLIEIDGQRVLIDPVWGERASPFTLMGPKRFHPVPIALGDLPPIDAVVISHDHYDHLDEPTISALMEKVPRFVVPLGVGAHLEFWGVAKERIVELDWWQDTEVGPLVLSAVPARHFSGRSIAFRDRDRSLWAGWVVRGPEHRVYYSGDTAMFAAFAEIGERLGPFDLSIIEVGAYDQLWADVHLGPEQAVAAHQHSRGAVMLPVHWGTFDLALHPWTEPIERVVAAAEIAGVRVVTPRPGESIDPRAPPPIARWWPNQPWRSKEQAPVTSSGLDSLGSAER